MCRPLGPKLVHQHGEAQRAKEVFRKHVDSVLSKSAKIRTLKGDLLKNYAEDETAKRLLEQ